MAGFEPTATASQMQLSTIDVHPDMYVHSIIIISPIIMIIDESEMNGQDFRFIEVRKEVCHGQIFVTKAGNALCLSRCHNVLLSLCRRMNIQQ